MIALPPCRGLPAFPPPTNAASKPSSRPVSATSPQSARQSRKSFQQAAGRSETQHGQRRRPAGNSEQPGALPLRGNGKLGLAIPALSRARDLDPDEDDFPFNLGLLSLQNNDLAAATAQFRDASEREPDNPEDRAFLINALEKAGKKDEAAEARGTAFESFGPSGLPALNWMANPNRSQEYQRVSRELDITSLRMQLATPAAVNNSSAESAAPIDPVVAHIRRGRQELGAGRVDTAEKEFRAALAADPKNAPALRELADVSRRRGKLDEAVQELQTSLALRDSATGRVMLARIYLEQKKPELARAEVEKAVKTCAELHGGAPVVGIIWKRASPREAKNERSWPLVSNRCIFSVFSASVLPCSS